MIQLLFLKSSLWFNAAAIGESRVKEPLSTGIYLKNKTFCSKQAGSLLKSGSLDFVGGRKNFPLPSYVLSREPTNLNNKDSYEEKRKTNFINILHGFHRKKNETQGRLDSGIYMCLQQRKGGFGLLGMILCGSDEGNIRGN